MAVRVISLMCVALCGSLGWAQAPVQEFPVVSAAPAIPDEPTPSAVPADSLVVEEPVPTEPATPPVVHLTLDAVPDELIEGQPAEIAWTTGPDIVSTEVLGWAEGATRGGQQVYGKVVVIRPTERSGSGRIAWTPPALDTIGFTLKVKAYSADGAVRAVVAKWLPYRPNALADQREDGVYIRLSQSGRQRLYLQKDGKLVRYLVCSGGAIGGGGHDHYGEFHIQRKAVDHYSSLNSAWRMRYAMHYHEGHAIHATTARFYGALGRGASHGCIRLHLTDARDLFRLVNLRTPVTIY